MATRPAPTLRARAGPLPSAGTDIDPDLHPQSEAAPSTLVGAYPFDEIAMEHAVAGDGIHLDDVYLPEQAEVVHLLTERGKSRVSPVS